MSTSNTISGEAVSQASTSSSYPFSDEFPQLLDKHLDHLKASAISIEVIKERGYITAMGTKALKDAGFSPAQRRAPGILIPLHAPDGSAAGYQYRPDRPREKEGGKIIKYENPTGSTIRLDVPPRCRQQLGDPSVEIWFTEGVKKVDALATAGACAVGLTGVWGFKGQNFYGGNTVLADFDYITFKGRHCYLVFDSDLSTNPRVRQALARLAEHLGRKGATIHLVYLPAGPAGEKTGADDYLAQGHNLQDLKALESKVLAALPPAVKKTSTQYVLESGRICWMKKTPDGLSEVPLCNFTAHVTEDIIRDNGAERNRFFKIEGKLASGHALPLIETTAAGFNSLNWVTSEWGMRAVIAAGQAYKDRLREAIQLLSAEAHQRTIYTHTGWRELNGEMIFLSGAGAMGRPDIEVELEPPLQRYQLLDPQGDAIEAIKRSFNFHLVASPEVTIPLWASMYLAPLTELIDPAFTLWLVGASGSFKSTLTALALCHFGTFDARHLPASWRDTANQLEKLLFLTKDLPLVIDDWAPGQDSAKSRELEGKAEYIIRAQGNRQGRGRMRQDTSSRPNYTPRGLLITSGEQLLSGHSGTARIYSLEIEREEVDMDYLGVAQGQAYFYCVAMTHYIAWLKDHWEHLQKTLAQRWREHRNRAQEGGIHPRLPEVIAGLYCAVELATEYAREKGAMTDSESVSLLKTSWEIFCRLAAAQAGRVEEERPGKRAMGLWRAMLDQGVAVWWSKDDDQPRVAAPGTSPIGWIDNNSGSSAFLLNPKAAYGALVQYGQKIGQPFTFKEEALWKDLKRMGISDCQDRRISSLAWIYGKNMRIIKLKNI